MDSDGLDRPVPLPTPVTAPFWAGLRQQRICVQHCGSCGHWVFYPRSHCNRCLSDGLTWETVDGPATLYSYTVARQATSPHFVDDVPQILAVAAFEQGFRMTTTLVNAVPEELKVGMTLRPVFDPVTDDMTMLRFEPA